MLMRELISALFLKIVTKVKLREVGLDFIMSEKSLQSILFRPYLLEAQIICSLRRLHLENNTQTNIFSYMKLGY